MPSATEHDLRCPLCSREPLLATYGIDEQGQPYIHVKVFKQRRIMANLIIRSGVVDLECRECGRWHTVKMVSRKTMQLIPSQQPQVLAHGA